MALTNFCVDQIFWICINFLVFKNMKIQNAQKVILISINQRIQFYSFWKHKENSPFSAGSEKFDPAVNKITKTYFKSS